MTPKLIKTEAEHEAALARVDELMDAKAGSAQESELEVWSVLIEKYEEEHFPIDLPDAVAAIQFRMEQRGLTQKDLVRFVPSKSKVSEVLRRKRGLSLNMIRSLHEGLGIPTNVLLQPFRAHIRPKRNRDTAAERKRRNDGLVPAK